MQLTNGQAKRIEGGRFAYIYNLGTGSAVSLEFKTDDSAFQAIEGFAFTANANWTIDVPRGELKATLDGDSTLFLNRVF